MFHKVNEKDEAVSPVIGVMLMLIVTAVIATVIAAFATGMFVDSSITPTALLEYSGQNTDSKLKFFDIEHAGGDVLSLENIVVVIDPIGSENYGIMLNLLAKDGNLEVPGKGSDALVSAGDKIRVKIPSGRYTEFGHGVIIKWSVSDIRTNGVLADGKFVVSNEEV